MISKRVLPKRYISDKSFGTAMFYMLTRETYSALHRLPTDEIFHFYIGNPVVMLLLHPNGRTNVITIGYDIKMGQQLQVVVPKGVWQGSFLKEGGKFALLGTTMAPGFDFSDYEAGDRDALIKQYPEYEELIVKLTPQNVANV